MIDPSVLSSFSLDGKIAIVTGAGSGIGRATAQLFHDVGAKVLYLDIAEEAVKAAAADTGSPYAICDISQEAQVFDAFDKVRELFGWLDVLVNVAAYRLKADTMAMPVSKWDIMHDVIARGTFLMMREAIKIIREQDGGGSIVNVSSCSAAHPAIFSNMHYDSAKAGVDAITRAAAVEFAPYRIRVNSVRPGVTANSGAQKVKQTMEIRGPITGPGQIPLGRSSDLIDQARAILFLASDAAKYITGQHLAVDGGYLVS